MTPQVDLRRVFAAAARMNQGEARKVVSLSIKALEAQMDAPQQSEGDRHYAKRLKSIQRVKSSVDRILEYARHETLRKIEKHFRDISPVESAEGDDAKPSSLAERLTFDRPDFTGELLAALREEGISALSVAGQQLFDEIGRDDPWKMPGKDSKAFLNGRANLLSNVPDEVHSEIMQSIQTGLEHGESRKELMARIGSAFDEIKRGRAETIANTETAAAFNYARDKAMREAGVTHKRWLHSQSPLIKEPRNTHVEDDGQTVTIDEPFDIGGVKFMYPSDDTLGAGPEDIINCHCVAIPMDAPILSGGEKPGHPFRGNQWTRGSAKPFAALVDGTVVGSIATKGHSSRNDLDILVTNYDHEGTVKKLSQYGFEYQGSSLVSPKEALASGKTFGEGWRRQETFKDLNGRTLGIWHEDK